MPHTGLKPIRLPSQIRAAVTTLLGELYRDIPLPQEPISNTSVTKKKTERNTTIRERFANGETLDELAAAYGISPQRVSQIIKGRRK